jgi:hypothetical protein
LNLSHKFYTEEGSKSQSLFVIKSDSDSILERDPFGHLRVSNITAGLLGVPVTSDEMKKFGNGKVSCKLGTLLFDKYDLSVVATLACLLYQQAPGGSLLLLSLARGWSGSREMAFQPKRCYLMLGGVITPPGFSVKR